MLQCRGIQRFETSYFCWSTGLVSAPALTASAVRVFLHSLSLPKNPSAPVVLGLPSHSSSCLGTSVCCPSLTCRCDTHWVIKFVFGSTWKVMSDLTSLSVLGILSV